MRWLSLAFVLSVAATAFVLSRPDSFASRWSPALSMPSEGVTIKMVDRWTH